MAAADLSAGLQRMARLPAALMALAALAGCAVGRDARPVRVAEVAAAAAPDGAPALWPGSAPPIAARHAILIEAETGRTLYQKNADGPIPPASTQKLLTALLILEDGNLNRRVVIAPEDTRVKPTKLGLRAGESYTRRELFDAMLVKSQNDAAAALARDVAGSEEAFVERMNRRAWELGARSSRFANAHGLPASQFSTARDIARIAWRAAREPEIRRACAIRKLPFVMASGRVKVLENTNKLLERDPTVTGMKTGYTIASGRCLVASARRGGRELIFVQLGSRTSEIFDDAERMLDWGFAQ
ncbi:MAG: D-alanyl-D-alanine carboxypeptidase [Terrimicrobiaceae bacterium]|nr:D-alanyl-D-alanine carboxypeptidase [Terrimicrobiaceae bacterium]